MNGPPLVVYGSLRRWSPQHFRATLQAYFLPASMMGMIGYWRAGLWTSTVTHEFLLSVPVMLPAVFLGRAISHRFSGTAFLRYVYCGLFLLRSHVVCRGSHASCVNSDPRTIPCSFDSKIGGKWRCFSLNNRRVKPFRSGLRKVIGAQTTAFRCTLKFHPARAPSKATPSLFLASIEKNGMGCPSVPSLQDGAEVPGFRDFPGSPVTKENRKYSHGTLPRSIPHFFPVEFHSSTRFVIHEDHVFMTNPAIHSGTNSHTTLDESAKALETLTSSLLDSQESLRKVGEESKNALLKEIFLAESLERARYRGAIENYPPPGRCARYRGKHNHQRFASPCLG